MKNLVSILIICAFLFSGCTSVTETTQTQNQEYLGKKILYIDSYHSGYEWSDGIRAGVKNTLEGTGVELIIHAMDTKRNTEESYKNSAGIKAKEVIEKHKPDLVIVSDDNAFKYLVMPYYKNDDLPFVFCGLNWDASLYGAPYKNTTGMVEVALVPQLIKHLKNYASGDRFGFIADDTITSHKEADYTERLFDLKLDQRYVKTLAEWKTAFLELQEVSDYIYVHNNAGINDWDTEEAAKFMEQNTSVPTGTIYTWMMPYSLIGLTNQPTEQGEWSAKTALRILDGEDPADIPLVQNKRGDVYVNLDIADKLGVEFEPSLLKNAEIVK